MDNTLNTLPSEAGNSSVAKRSVRVLAVTGGKGGVGKTNVSINLAVQLAKKQQRVLLLDADLGLANIDVLLGLRVKHNLEDIFAGNAELKDIMLDGPAGIKVIPASSGTQSMVKLTQQEHAGLIAAFSELVDDIDVLIVDTAAGISDAVVSFSRAAQEILIVVCDEPSSITDAYALIKLLNKEYGVQNFRVLANQTRSEKEGGALFNRLVDTTDRFLDVVLQYAGQVPYDENVRKAVKKQQAVSLLYPKSSAAQSFIELAEKVESWPLPVGPSGYLEFFVEQLLDNSSR